MVARDNLYYACRHGGIGRGMFFGTALQVPKLGRFFAWWWQGKLGFAGALRCFGKHLLGTLAGLGKGLLRGPRLPLEPLPEVEAKPTGRVEAAPTTEPSVHHPEPV